MNESLDVTRRCKNCGCTKDEHAVKKPYKCPTRLKNSHWEPWTGEAYEAAEQAGRAAAKATTKPFPPIPVEEPREILLEPNFKALFRQFLGDAKHAGMCLTGTLAAAQFDKYPETPDALRLKAAVLRAVQGYLAPITIAINAATSREEINQLRELMANVLSTIDGDAFKTETEAEDAGER